MAVTTKTGKISSTHRPVTWFISLCCALLVNVLLFWVMPFLQGRHAARPLPVRAVIPVSVVAMPEKPRQNHRPPPSSASLPEGSIKPATPAQTGVKMRLETPSLQRFPVKITSSLPGPDISIPAPEAPFKAASSLFARVASQGTFTPDQLDALPATEVRIPPVYPPAARRRGVEGWVKVKFLVDEQGEVEEIQVLKAEPPGYFERSVRRCVSQWRFSPPKFQGMPASVWMETVIRFKLDR